MGIDVDPTTVTQVKAFVGLVSYCSDYFLNMAQVLAPVCALTKDLKQFQWSKKCHEAFEFVK